MYPNTCSFFDLWLAFLVWIIMAYISLKVIQNFKQSSSSTISNNCMKHFMYFKKLQCNETCHIVIKLFYFRLKLNKKLISSMSVLKPTFYISFRRLVSYGILKNQLETVNFSFGSYTENINQIGQNYVKACIVYAVISFEKAMRMALPVQLIAFFVYFGRFLGQLICGE